MGDGHRTSGRGRVASVAVSRRDGKRPHHLLLGENNELKSRHLLIGSERELPAFKKGCQKKVVRKGCQKTVERVLSMLKKNSNLTQVGLAVALGVSRQAIQKHLTGLKKSGLLRRIGPDKGGHWEVVGT